MEPSALPLLASAVLALYVLTLLGLALFGAHRYWLVHRYFHPREPLPIPLPTPPGDLPRVLVQLPIFNERYVVPRLLQSLGRFDYPRDRLEIQILDDSTDDTPDVVALEADRLRADGWRVDHVRRPDRIGFKAGALAFGLQRSDAPLIAVFDADFVPPPDFLPRTVGYFADPRIGLVQTRWGHVNETYNALTRLQALLLDGHFVMDHGGRAHSGCFFNFNGTAGVWRRAAIDDAGGWTHDTVTEDLDLSYRAQLAGWQFIYAPEVEAPAELPVQMLAFKSQQHRWTKGAGQTARKLLGPIWRSPLDARRKLEASLHLLGNTPYILMVLLATLLLPVYWLRHRYRLDWVVGVDLPMLGLGVIALAAFYANARRELGRSPWRAVFYLPALMALGMGLSLNNAWAAIEGWLRPGGEFVRTPKYSIVRDEDVQRQKVYAARRQRSLPVLEALMLAYLLLTTAFSLHARLWWTLPFLVLFLAGYAYVCLHSLRPNLSRHPASAPLHCADTPS